MGTICPRPQLRSYPRLRDNPCSPNSGFAVRLGPVEMLSGEVSPQEMRPQSARLLFPASRPRPALSQPRGYPKDLLCRGPNPRGVLRTPGGTGRERGSSRPELWARVPSQVRAGRRARGCWLRGDPGLPAAPGVCPAGTCLPRPESVTRPGISKQLTRVSRFPRSGSDLCLPRAGRAGSPAAIWPPRSSPPGSPAVGALGGGVTEGSLVCWGHTRTRDRESVWNCARMGVHEEGCRGGRMWSWGLVGRTVTVESNLGTTPRRDGRRSSALFSPLQPLRQSSLPFFHTARNSAMAFKINKCPLKNKQNKGKKRFKTLFRMRAVWWVLGPGLEPPSSFAARITVI